MTDQLQFKLDVFEGPLDLLLHLVQKNKLNIENIPIAEITRQYLEYIDLMRFFDIEVASEFLVMAAQLLLIKSRMLLPTLQEEEENPIEELQERLMEYKKIKEAAHILEESQFSSLENYFKAPEGIEKAPVVNKEMPVERLLDAFYDILKRELSKAPPPRTAFSGIIQKKWIPIEEKILHISRFIKIQRKVKFSSLFENASSKDELIASFLAILQLVSRGQVSINESGKDIFLKYTGGDKDYESRAD